MSHSHKKRIEEILHDQFTQGYEAGKEAAFKSIYACCLIGAKDAFGFGCVRGMRLLKAIDRAVTSGMYINGEEALEDVYNRYGITLRFKNEDPLDQSTVKETQA